MRSIFAADDSPHIEIGTVYPTDDIRGALYVDPMLRSTSLCWARPAPASRPRSALILHRISDLSPEGHIVMIDPHGEYSAAFKGCGELFNVDNLQLPYWLMNFEEHCEVFLTTRRRRAPARRRHPRQVPARRPHQGQERRAIWQGHRRFADPLPADRSVNAILVNEMGKLDRAGDTRPYKRLKNKLDELRADPRYTFMFSGMLVSDSMAGFIAKLFRLPARASRSRSSTSRASRPKSPRSSSRCLPRMVFDYAIWTRTEAQRPLLLVCEEAHRYVPKDENASGQAVRKILERIAKEGRKYGVSLGLITQRPSDLAEGVLSQCGTIISMRLNNDRDQACVRAAMPEGARGFLDAIPALRNRECIVCGEGVAIPIRVRFDDLEPEKRPASSDPSFAALWRETGGEEGIIQRTDQALARSRPLRPTPV